MPAHDQHRYQIRFEWGAEGFARLAPSDVVVVVDVLSPPTDAAGDAPEGGAIARVAGLTDAVVLHGSLRTAAATAHAALAEQERRGTRTSIAVIAAGETDGAGRLRIAVEDLLGAGAVIDALGVRGIDHTSPEAAAAGESFRGLRSAVRHLLTASGSGQELIDAGRRDDVLRAAEIDADTVAVVLSAASAR